MHIMELDGSRWEAVNVYASACAHSPLLHTLAGDWRLFGEGGFVWGDGVFVLHPACA